MIATCQCCGAHEKLAAHQFAGRTALVRCTLCRGIMVADVMAFESRRWWAMINDKMCGPFTSREVRTLVEHGEIHMDSHMWVQGMDDWERIVESQRLGFAAAWIRNLQQPELDEVQDALLPTVTGIVTEAEPDEKGFVPLSFSALAQDHPTLSEVGIQAAVAMVTLAVMGTGVLASGVFI